MLEFCRHGAGRRGGGRQLAVVPVCCAAAVAIGQSQAEWLWFQVGLVVRLLDQVWYVVGWFPPLEHA